MKKRRYFDSTGAWRKPWWFWRTLNQMEYEVPLREALADNFNYWRYLRAQGVRKYRVKV